MANDKKSKYQGYRLIDGDRAKEAKLAIDTRRDRAAKNADGRPTNDYFAKHDALFMEACERAGIPNTARQASKYQRKLGKAYGFMLDIEREKREAAANAS